jgi:hypothetical protein
VREGTDGHRLEDDHLAGSTLPLQPLLSMVANAEHLADIAHNARIHISEQMDVLHVGQMVPDRAIPSHEGHIPHLALASVQEDAFVRPAIPIAELLPLVTGEEQ